VQGKTERVTDLLPLLGEFHHDKLCELLRHQAGARLVGQYDVNNTYQYIINREETQLAWIVAAIVDLGAAVADDLVEPDRRAPASGPAVSNGIFEEDAAGAQAFVDRWRPRVEEMTNARQRGMLRVVLGETLEQKRFFEQARAGRTDLLGRRSEHVGSRVGHVLPTRWTE
jgi:hypothetical protein